MEAADLWESIRQKIDREWAQVRMRSQTLLIACAVFALAFINSLSQVYSFSVLASIFGPREVGPFRLEQLAGATTPLAICALCWYLSTEVRIAADRSAKKIINLELDARAIAAENPDQFEQAHSAPAVSAVVEEEVRFGTDRIFLRTIPNLTQVFWIVMAAYVIMIIVIRLSTVPSDGSGS